MGFDKQHHKVVSIESAINLANQPTLEPLNYFPHFQPIVFLPSGQIAGYEALARTHQQHSKVVSAGELFSNHRYSLSERRNIDRVVRKQALEQFAAAEQDGFLTLNIVPDWVDMLSSKICTPTIAMIDEIGIDPAKVVIEITEASGNIDNLQRVVKAYHQAGLKVAIDDFGAGASQLDRIIALEPDIIKLDMRLFKNATKGGLPADVVLSVAELVQRVGCELICEGVETEQEFHFGVECGARYMQGWLFHKAEERFLPAQDSQAKVKQLLASYLQRKSHRTLETVKHNVNVKTSVLALKHLIQNVQSVASLAAQLVNVGILRYFLCKIDGTQVSPNFDVTEQGIIEDNQFVGANWSFRPYFHALIALDSVKPQQLILSKIYRDSSSKEMCKTFSTYISKDVVLLVDCKVKDDTLFVD
ncbi:EAL domain-containing protein [Agarivorans sp. TSD2052]|uniref:EAL domain-containing protein n=1 Tax=Agarivorans sp. TSD2052 TaxID=2937286 RepID=UPI002010686F|nr:EAL domain-containing protein [Agarivorans sp. TSD2052]UPW17609.1 EAL domain-containing protein [Agarivorans sp. TSD2052]